jgi:hypothetical protein
MDANQNVFDENRQVAAQSTAATAATAATAGQPAEIRQSQAPSPDPVVAPRITPDPKDNPMQSVPASEREKAIARRDNGLPSDRSANWYERARGYLPFRKPESEEKSPATVKDDETVSPLIRKFRDKTFSYQKGAGGGVWVDYAYNPEVMYWRVTRVVQGSKEYERLMAEDPQLKEFFSLGRVIVVWRGKVYRVTRR